MSAIAADPVVFAVTSPIEQSRHRNLIRNLIRDLIRDLIIAPDRFGTGLRAPYPGGAAPTPRRVDWRSAS